jgi:hypothetical protein
MFQYPVKTKHFITIELSGLRRLGYAVVFGLFYFHIQ